MSGVILSRCPLGYLFRSKILRLMSKSIYLKPGTKNPTSKRRAATRAPVTHGRRNAHSAVPISLPSVINSGNIGEILTDYDTFLVDCDGVLWATDHFTSFSGIEKAISTMNKFGQVFYVTNNSILARSEYSEKFERYNIHAPMETIFCVSYTAAVYLKYVAGINGLVYVIGGTGMEEELNMMGIENFGVGIDPDIPTADSEKLLKFELRDDVKAVVVGFDPFINYNKLYKATNYLSNPDCMYIATSSLEVSVRTGSRIQPVTGPIVHFISSASKREPIIVGKPHVHMFECILEKFPNIDKNKILMIGDNLRADIGFAQNAGINSLLVLTGASKLEDMEKFPGYVPTYYATSLSVFGEGI